MSNRGIVQKRIVFGSIQSKIKAKDRSRLRKKNGNNRDACEKNSSKPGWYTRPKRRWTKL